MSRYTPRSATGALILGLLILTGCGGGGDKDEGLSYMTRGETYAEQGQYRSAMLEIKNAIQQEPGNIHYILGLADIYLTIGAANEASDLLAPWMESKPDQVGLKLAQAYLGQSKHLSALETLDKTHPKTESGRVLSMALKGEALRLAGNNDKALEAFEQALALQPSDQRATAGKIRTYMALNNPVVATELADQWLTANAPDAEILLLKGKALYYRNQLELSTEVLTQAISELPSADYFLPLRRDALSLISRVLTEQGKITEAQVYNRVLSENSDSEAEQQAKAAITAIREGRFEEAAETLNDLHQLNPDNSRIGLTLGALNLQQGNVSEGLNLLEGNLDPETSPTAFIRLTTLARIDQGDRLSALETLTRAAEARPNDPELITMHGLLALSLPGHEQQGLASISKAQSLQPQNVRLRLVLSRYYQANGQAEQALGQLRMAFATKPDEWATTSAYLNLLIKNGNLDEIAELKDSLVNGYPDDRPARLLADIALDALGDHDKAVADLRQLVKEDPEDPGAKTALARLYVNSGQPVKAADTLVQAAVNNPKAMVLLQQAATLYAREKGNGQALTDWIRSIAVRSPELTNEVRALEILAYTKRGKLVDARKLLDTTPGPDLPAPVSQAGTSLLIAEAMAAARTKNWTAAHEAAEQAIAMQPGNLDALLTPVKIQVMKGDTEQAAQALDAIEQRLGSPFPVTLVRAAILEARGNAAEAFQYLERQWQESSNPAFMPHLLRLSGKTAPEKRTELARQWLRLQPDNPAAQMALADELLKAGDNIQASTMYEQVIMRRPDYVPALNNLAWVLRENNLKRALELSEQALTLAPDDASVLDTHGWLLHLNGKHQLALGHLERALEKKPESQEIRQHLNAVKSVL